MQIIGGRPRPPRQPDARRERKDSIADRYRLVVATGEHERPDQRLRGLELTDDRTHAARDGQPMLGRGSCRCDLGAAKQRHRLKPAEVWDVAVGAAPRASWTSPMRSNASARTGASSASSATALS